MPKPKQTKKRKRLTSTRIAIGDGRYLKNMWLLEICVAQLELMEPDWEINSAVRRTWSDPSRPAYVDEVGHGDDFRIDMLVAASAEGRVPASVAEDLRSFGDDATMTPKRVEKLLGSLARAGVIAWEPGATSIELRPRERR